MAQYALVKCNINGKDVEKIVDVRASLTDMLRRLGKTEAAENVR